MTFQTTPTTSSMYVLLAITSGNMHTSCDAHILGSTVNIADYPSPPTCILNNISTAALTTSGSDEPHLTGSVRNQVVYSLKHIEARAAYDVSLHVLAVLNNP